MGMKRRDFVGAGSVLAGVGAASWGGAAHAQLKFEEGTDYQLVEPRAAVEAPAGKIELVEFFWYACPHCNAFEPALEAWVKQLPKDVVFRRVPVQFRDDFVPLQRLYYALEAMGLVEKLHAKVFAAIHVEKQDLSKPAAIIEWVGRNGVDKVKFSEQFNGFTAASKATKATQLQNAYRIEGVPTLGVAGRYFTDGTLAKGMDRSVKVAEYLIATARHAK
jgi:thiol:disulfide interchange protein DsbA